MVVQQEPSHLQRAGGSETGDIRSASQRSAKAHIPHNFWLKLLEKRLLGLQELGQALQLCTSSVYHPEQVKRQVKCCSVHACTCRLWSQQGACTSFVKWSSLPAASPRLDVSGKTTGHRTLQNQWLHSRPHLPRCAATDMVNQQAAKIQVQNCVRAKSTTVPP